MRIRIPTPLNRAIDTAQAHPRISLIVGSALAVAWPVAVWWASPAAAVITAVGLSLYVVGGVVATRFLWYRETIRQLRYELAAERLKNARLREGDPSALTAQIRPIPDGGERP